LVKVTSPEPCSTGDWIAAVNRVKLKVLAFDKAKILKTAEVKILPFINMKQTGISTITLVPITELHPKTSNYFLLEIYSGQQGG